MTMVRIVCPSYVLCSGHDWHSIRSFFLLVMLYTYCSSTSYAGFCLRPGKDVAKDLKEVLEVSSY